MPAHSGRWILGPAALAAVALAGPARGEEGPIDTRAAITTDEIGAHVSYLASDALAGRGTGSEGERMAAAYLSERFEAAGAEPGSAEGTFLQPFTVPGPARLEGAPELRLDVGPWSRELEADQDFRPFSFSAAGSVDAPLVFAGYGVTDPERGYDDYAGLDVEGKAVLVLRHEPREEDGVGPHSYFTRKARNAAEHGAAALLVVTDPANHPHDEELVPFHAGGDEAAEIPAAHVRQSLVEGLFDLADRDLTAVQRRIDERLRPSSFALDARVRLDVAIERQDLQANNVVARIPGSDPERADEVVVIGAHYDHLGRGGQGSLAPDAEGEIHNGADDNASGTAALVEMAEAFAAAPPKRTVYLVAFSGEELGLLGSRHFVEHPPVDRERIAAMVNLDMIGRLEDEALQIGGVGTSPGFPDLVREAASEHEVGEVLLSESGSGPSDHSSFYRAGVPVLFFFTGLHEDYHRPSDDVAKVDLPGATRIVRTAFACAQALADARERPEYVETERERRGPRAVIGIRVARGFDGEGVAVRSVGDGGPAEAAGLRPGDVIVAFDGAGTPGIRALLGALRERSPGDEVSLEVRRGEETRTVPLTLGRR